MESGRKRWSSISTGKKNLQQKKQITFLKNRFILELKIRILEWLLDFISFIQIMSSHCGHICNASYAVKKDIRGQHIGEKLVKDCIVIGKEKGYRILQFNAVVASNIHALHLYHRLGFIKLGVIPQGFKLPDGTYEDIIPHYITL